MKIISIKAVPASSSPEGRPPRNYMFVKIETDEGITGWGEATAGPLSVATQIDEVGQVLIGEDPWQIVKMIQPDIVQGGGILELKKIAAMAEAHYVGFQPHNPYGPLCTISSLHLDACTPNFMIQEGGTAPWFQDACTGDFPVQKDGFFPIPPGPGLGVAMNEAWLKANPWRDDATIWRPRPGTIASLQDTPWV